MNRSRPMPHLLRIAALSLSFIFLAAPVCGDDDPPATDTGVQDSSGMEASTADMTGEGTLPDDMAGEGTLPDDMAGEGTLPDDMANDTNSPNDLLTGDVGDMITDQPYSPAFAPVGGHNTGWRFSR